MNSSFRAKTLNTAIKSIIKLKQKVDRIVISVSYEKKEFDTILPSCDYLTILKSNSKKCQFEHYETIVKAIKFNDNDILFFMDDDDLIIPSLTEKVIPLFNDNTVKSVRFLYQFFNKKIGDIVSTIKVEEKDRVIVLGDDPEMDSYLIEYFCYAVRAILLKNFLTSPGYKKEYYDDIGFGDYIDKFVTKKLDEVFYYKRCHQFDSDMNKL